MIINAISVTGLPSNYEQTVSLEGVDFVFRVLWNERAHHHFMTIRDSNGVDLITARKIVVNIPFAVHDTIAGMPAGQLWFVDTIGGGVDPALRELGQRVKLFYVDAVNVPS